MYHVQLNNDILIRRLVDIPSVRFTTKHVIWWSRMKGNGKEQEEKPEEASARAQRGERGWGPGKMNRIEMFWVVDFVSRPA